MNRNTPLRRRERKVKIIEHLLLRKSMPRLQVSVILLCSGVTAFLTSFSLLHLDDVRMSLRYPIAILVAYFVFLVLLRLWLWANGRRLRFDPDLSALDFIPSRALSRGDALHFGGGGDFSGAGGGGSWGGGSSSITVSHCDSGSSGIGFDLDLEEAWLLVISLVALLGGLIASLYIIYIAPALLAEIFVDGVLVIGLYKRVRRVEQRYWLRAAVRRTVLPTLIVTLFFFVAGYAMQKAVPEARSIVDVLRHVG